MSAVISCKSDLVALINNGADKLTKEVVGDICRFICVSSHHLQDFVDILYALDPSGLGWKSRNLLPNALIVHALDKHLNSTASQEAVLRLLSLCFLDSGRVSKLLAECPGVIVYLMSILTNAVDQNGAFDENHLVSSLLVVRTLIHISIGDDTSRFYIAQRFGTTICGMLSKLPDPVKSSADCLLSVLTMKDSDIRSRAPIADF